MKKVFLLMGGLFVAAFLNAQVTMQPGIPAVGMVQKDQLWNILVVNSANTAYDCRLELVLRDRLTGQEVLTAVTGLFGLPPGAKQLNINVVNPVQYNYIVSGIGNRLQGLLPAGTYTACYRLVNVTSKDNLTEECIPFDVEPLSPPMLIFPADSAQLETAPNQLSWTPPSPDGMFDRLHYEIVIAAINEGQKASEAVQENLPFYADGTLYTNVMNYSGAANGFEKDRWYAWQVVAKDDGNYAGKSEVWVFKVTSKITKPTVTNDVYLVMKDDIRRPYEIDGKVLHMKYYSAEGGYETTIRFTDSKGRLIKTEQQKVTSGDNYFSFTLNNQFQPGNSYTVSLVDKNNKPHILIFSTNSK